MVRMELTNRKMRTMLIGEVGAMRTLRAEVLKSSKLEPDVHQRYKERVVTAAGFVDALTVTGLNSYLEQLFTIHNSDSSLLTYDSTQNAWWFETDAGKDFIGAMQRIAMFYFRSGIQDQHDLFHMLQIARHLYSEDGERQTSDFLSPAYGGLKIPFEYVGRLLVHETSNPNLVPIQGKDQLVLKLNWWPDDRDTGVREVETLLKAARKLGYLRVEFNFPTCHKYEKLSAVFGQRLQVRQEDKNWIASISCFNGENGFHSNRLLQLIESGDKLITDVSDGEFSENKVQHIRNHKTVTALAIDSVLPGINRLMFTFAGEFSLHGGFYFGISNAPDPTAVLNLVNDLLKDTKSDISSNEVIQFVLTQLFDSHKAMFIYATVVSGNHEIEVDQFRDD